MKTIGLLVGREETFPDALIEEINRRDAGCKAEYVQLEGTPHAEVSRYSVILDRISHEVTYYQTAMKVAVLNGCVVINNPFWKLADDKFFGTALVSKLGIAVPKSVALPNYQNVEGIEPESLGNLKFPLDWEGIMGWIGFPAILKPHWGGGWKSVDKVENMEELFDAYHRSKTLCMMLQEFINWDHYVRCICIGQDNINPVPWDPTLPHHERYSKARCDIDPALMQTIVEQAQTLCRALGYDMNTVEFAIKDGVPYAIDFMNTAPDLDRNSLTEDQFLWAVDQMATLLIDRAHNPPANTKNPMRWDQMLSL
ncbi:MAG: hypothetical protein KDB53_01235 [Planctomycetes bacterium]|nr:hypothetical protein [Planctomycetota bacterium]